MKSLGRELMSYNRVDAGHLLSPEDRIVAVELLMDALSGKPIEEDPGGSNERGL